MVTSVAKPKVAMNQPHLSQTERYIIALLNTMNYRQKQIAATLCRSPSSISRELKRNTTAQGYNAIDAIEQARTRSLNSRNARRIDADTLDAVKAKLRIEHSPEQIAAHLPISHSAFTNSFVPTSATVARCTNTVAVKSNAANVMVQA